MQNGAMPEKVEALQERLVLELSERMIYTGKRFTDSFQSSQETFTSTELVKKA